MRNCQLEKNQSELRKSEKAKNRQKSKNAIFRKMNADALNLDELDYDDEDESHNLKNALPVVDLLEDESDGRKRSNEESENQRNRPNSDEEEEEEEGALSDDSDDGEIKSGKKHFHFPLFEMVNKNKQFQNFKIHSLKVYSLAIFIYRSRIDYSLP